MVRIRVSALVLCLVALVMGASATVLAQQSQAPPAQRRPGTAPSPSRRPTGISCSTWARSSSSAARTRDCPASAARCSRAIRCGPSIGTSLDQAVNVVPGVVSTFDANGRRNESDIFVRGFGRWQVPLMLDGVRIYLPADNRLDFSRFLTADIAEVQIQKGYASVLDGPGAMGGAINLVTRKPDEGARGRRQRLARRPRRQRRVERLRDGRHAAAEVLRCRAASTTPTGTSGRCRATTSRPPTLAAARAAGASSSDSADSRFNVKAGFTPNDTDEYTLNYIKQQGEKGAPLNVIQQPAGAAEQLLALAVLGRPEHVVPVARRSSAPRRT